MLHLGTWFVLHKHPLDSSCALLPRDAYRSAFVTEFANDLEAMRQQAAASDSELPLDELVRLISNGTNVFSSVQKAAFTQL